MTGDIPEMLVLAIKYGVRCEFTLSFGRKEIYAVPIKFNIITGRLIVRGGSKNYTWVRSFLLKQVKCYTFPAELYDTYASRDDISR